MEREYIFRGSKIRLWKERHSWASSVDGVFFCWVGSEPEAGRLAEAKVATDLERIPAIIRRGGDLSL